MIRTIAFDADDTLWHNERIFLEVKEQFIALLAQYHTGEWIEAHLNETEERNLRRYGYGIKSFTLSMIETAVELTENRVTGEQIGEILDYGKQMMDHPVELLDGVRPTIEALSGSYELMIVTKGDLFDQESKVARSGLGDRFSHVEIVSDKEQSTYRAIAARRGLQPHEFLMVGNSLRSDIIPVVEFGGHAIHIPYFTTWEHEHVSDERLADLDFISAETIWDLPRLVQEIDASR